MAFVKLDCQMLDSSIWIERLQRELFITALLMATPIELKEPTPTLELDSLCERSDFVVPPGWYGFVGAASSGIISRAQIEDEQFNAAMVAIKELGEEDMFSRSLDFEGRRMVRVDGGFLILNYDRFREKDHTAAERSRRYRERKLLRRDVTSRDVANGVTLRSVTQAEAEAEAEVIKHNNKSVATLPDCIPLESWNAFSEMRKKQRKPMTDRAAKMIIRKLEDFNRAGWNIGAILDQSTVNCWQDVFPLRETIKGKGNAKDADVGKWDGTISATDKCYRCGTEITEATTIEGIFCSKECAEVRK